jgi:hypothetical protein
VTLSKESSAKCTLATTSLWSTFYQTLYSAKSLLSVTGTWQRKVVITAPGNGDGAFAECPQSGTRQGLILCRVPTGLALNKGTPMGPFVSALGGTRQRLTLCRLSAGLALKLQENIEGVSVSLRVSAPTLLIWVKVWVLLYRHS